MYLWIKALHVIAVIAWMAGLLYLPRLFVYHVKAEIGSVQSETFKVMERRLLRAIMTPAMIVSWVAGLIMVLGYGTGWGDGTFWLHAKLALVIGMSVVHMMLARMVRIFANDANTRSGVYYRVLNEVPTLGMIAVVILVIVKPF